MSPRKRNPENTGLPKRWQFYHGAYHYQVPKGQEHHWDGKKKFRLGDQLHEAYKVWAQRLEAQIDVRRIEHLLDRYLLEVTPAKAKRTQVDEPRYATQLKKRFGHMRLEDLEPQHIYQYFDKRTDQTKDKEGKLVAATRNAKNQARQEIKLLSHAFTKAVEWGYVKKHPFKKEVRFDRERGQKPRDRYVEDWEIIEVLSLKPFRKRGSVLMIQGYIRLKLLTGMRMTDLLNLQPNDLKEDGIHVKASKTQHSSGVKQIFTWLDKDGNDTGRSAAVDRCLAVRPLDIAPYVFCTGEGDSYVDEDGRTTNFNSVWKRFMDRVLKETKVTQRFAERDLRAKAATDKEEAEGLERARKLLGHVDARITKKWYMRKPEIVR